MPQSFRKKFSDLPSEANPPEAAEVMIVSGGVSKRAALQGMLSNLSTNTTIPADDAGGKYFIWGRTNGDWLMRWDGAAWVPEEALGNTVIYVDNTNGTDAQGKGDGTGADAFATPQYAWDNSPNYGTGEIRFICANETYTLTGNLYFYGKHAPKGVIWQGFKNVALSGTADGTGVVTGINGTFNVTGGGMTTNEHTNSIIVWDDDSQNGKNVNKTGTNSPIISNTTTGVTSTYLRYAPVNGDAFTIYDQSTTWEDIVPNGTYSISVDNCSFELMKMVNTSVSKNGGGTNWLQERVNTGHISYFTHCWFIAGQDRTLGQNYIQINTGSNAMIMGCYIEDFAISLFSAYVEVWHCHFKVVNHVSTSAWGIIGYWGADILVRSSRIDGHTQGLYAYASGGSEGSNQFRNCTHGIYAVHGSILNSTTAAGDFINCTNDKTAAGSGAGLSYIY